MQTWSSGSRDLGESPFRIPFQLGAISFPQSKPAPSPSERQLDWARAGQLPRIVLLQDRAVPHSAIPRQAASGHRHLSEIFGPIPVRRPGLRKDGFGRDLIELCLEGPKRNRVIPSRPPGIRYWPVPGSRFASKRRRDNSGPARNRARPSRRFVARLRRPAAFPAPVTVFRD